MSATAEPVPRATVAPGRAHPAAACTAAEFAASYGLASPSRVARVERCGCTGNPFCRGWQLVPFGKKPLYAIPA